MFNTIWVLFLTVFILVPALIFIGLILLLGLESVHYGLSKKFPFKGFKHVIDDAHVFVKQHLLAIQHGHWKLHH
jgi:hypothetical protein